MGFGERLKDLRKSKGLSQKELAEMLDVSAPVVGNYEQNKNYPTPAVFIRIMECLECDANYLYQDYIGKEYAQELSEEEHNIIKEYRTLSPHAKEIVRTLLNMEYKASVERIERGQLIPLDMYIPVKKSAGYVLFDNAKKIWCNNTALNGQADYGIKIITINSTPVFNMGDIALIRNGLVNHNEIGLFKVNGIVHIKKLYRRKGVTKLIPFNVSVDPVNVLPGDEFEILGQVIGKLEGNYVE